MFSTFLSQKPTIEQLSAFLSVQEMIKIALVSANVFRTISKEKALRVVGASASFNHDWAKACRIGNLDVIMYLVESKRASQSLFVQGINYAARRGQLEIVQWLHENVPIASCTDDAMDWAARGGHLPVIQFLHVNRQEGCTTYAMDWAACEGHLETLIWLYENREEGCSHLATDWAAVMGHFSIVKWLFENKLGSVSVALVSSAAGGHLTIVKWLCENHSAKHFQSAILMAEHNRRDEIVEYLRRHVRRLEDDFS